MQQVIDSSPGYYFIFMFVNRGGQVTSQLAFENGYTAQYY